MKRVGLGVGLLTVAACLPLLSVNPMLGVIVGLTGVAILFLHGG